MTGSASRGQQVSWFAADVDPALAPAGCYLVVTRADSAVEFAGSGNQGTDDGFAHVVTCELAVRVFVSGASAVQRTLSRLPSGGSHQSAFPFAAV